LAFSFLGFSASSLFFSSASDKKKRYFEIHIYKSIKSRECERREKGRDLGGGYICSSYSSSEGLSREIQSTLSSLSLSSLLFFFFLSFFFCNFLSFELRES